MGKNQRRKGRVIWIAAGAAVFILCIAAYIVGVKLYWNQKEKGREPLYTRENYPKVDASLATQPLTDALRKEFTGLAEFSEEELALAREAGVELEVIPVVKEGFVFYVNSENAVDSLTVEQIQKIYTGEITNWKEVGGVDAPIRAFQRPVNSGSQTGMLSLVMKGLPLMEAPKENLVGTMEDIINLVSSYDNGKEAIGYSYYYYATTMFQTIDADVANHIRLLAVNGVTPCNDTIRDSSYPFTTAYYIVINKADKEDSAARILAGYMLSERGQRAAEAAGYVPVK